MLLLITLLGMLSIIPLSIWAATGNLRRAWDGTKEYLFVMGCIAAPVLVVVGITQLTRAFQ